MIEQKLARLEELEQKFTDYDKVRITLFRS